MLSQSIQYPLSKYFPSAHEIHKPVRLQVAQSLLQEIIQVVAELLPHVAQTELSHNVQSPDEVKYFPSIQESHN